MASYYAEEMPHQKHEFMTGQHERMAHLRSLGTRIKLRLNPKEHAKLIMLVENYVINMVKEEEEKEKVENDKEDTLDTDSIHEKELMKEAQRVLKLEWKRVKNGEIAFRITKYAALSVSILALCSVINTVFFSTSNSSPLRPMKTASIIQHHNEVC
ncbi:hypothetical protein QPK32_07515 [Massilia sp. YIM B02763]|uniref:hypothetical protein n=1 Tax=Massilia sp. YIM B02763 TaxID=3050130 RepID=UPI0025B72136|nr:hypothetical protein [Massilia sp. YIM B02763]MDN4052921.1 hypothetical protein [Massilia sp. YIM B02763]